VGCTQPFNAGCNDLVLPPKKKLKKFCADPRCHLRQKYKLLLDSDSPGAFVS